MRSYFYHPRSVSPWQSVASPVICESPRPHGKEFNARAGALLLSAVLFNE